MTTETPKQEAFRLKMEALECDIYGRIREAAADMNVEACCCLHDELKALDKERKHFAKWHGPDATVDDSYAARTR